MPSERGYARNTESVILTDDNGIANPRLFLPKAVSGKSCQADLRGHHETESGLSPVTTLTGDGALQPKAVSGEAGWGRFGRKSVVLHDAGAAMCLKNLTGAGFFQYRVWVLERNL